MTTLSNKERSTRAIEDAFDRLDLLPFLSFRAQQLTEHLELVNVKEKQIRCQGKCQDGGTCTRTIAKMDVVIAVLGLQLIAFDASIAGSGLEQRLDVLYHNHLLCTTSNHHLQSTTKAGEARKKVESFRSSVGLGFASLLPMSLLPKEEQGVLVDKPVFGFGSTETPMIKREEIARPMFDFAIPQAPTVTEQETVKSQLKAASTISELKAEIKTLQTEKAAIKQENENLAAEKEKSGDLNRRLLLQVQGFHIDKARLEARDKKFGDLYEDLVLRNERLVDEKEKMKSVEEEFEGRNEGLCLRIDELSVQTERLEAEKEDVQIEKDLWKAKVKALMKEGYVNSWEPETRRSQQEGGRSALHTPDSSSRSASRSADVKEEAPYGFSVRKSKAGASPSSPSIKKDTRGNVDKGTPTLTDKAPFGFAVRSNGLTSYQVPDSDSDDTDEDEEDYD